MSPAKPHPHSARLSDPAVVAKIRSVIGRRVQAADRDDVEQAAVLRMFMLPELPPDDDGLLGMVVVMTKRALCDHFRKVARARGREVDAQEMEEVLGIPESPTGMARERVEEVIAFVDEHAERGEYPATVVAGMRLILQGYTQDEAAEKLGQKPGTFRSNMSRVLADVRKRWPAYVIGVMAVLLAIFLPRRPSPTEDRTTIGYEPPPPPVFSAPVEGNPEEVDMPPKLWREFAYQACNVEIDYARCERYLDKAKKLDPDGEFLPEVKRMRDDIHRHRFGYMIEPEAGLPPPNY